MVYKIRALAQKWKTITGIITIIVTWGVAFWLGTRSPDTDMASFAALFDWIERPPIEFFTVVLTAALVICTALLARFTKSLSSATDVLATETRNMRELQTTPRIDVRVELDESSGNYLNLILRNEGRGPAKNVRFFFDGDPSYYRNTLGGDVPPVVPELPLIREGLASWESGRTFKFTLGSASKAEFDRAREVPWTFHVEYEDLSGKKIHEKIEVDFSLLQGSFFEENHLKEISEDLGEIRKDFRSLTGGSSRLQVVTQSIQERRKELEEWRKSQGL